MARRIRLKSLRAPFALLTLLLAPGGPAASQARHDADPARAFERGGRLPLDVRAAGVEEREGARVYDLSYANVRGPRVKAYFVVPTGPGPFAGVLCLHGGGQDRSTFLGEALRLGRAGAVSLLVDVPAVRAAPNFTRPEVDRDLFADTLTGLRRGVDLLTRRGDVDAKRLGYVGMSYGANLGGVLAGFERRVKAYALIAGLPSYTDLWRSGTHPGAVRVRESLTAEQLESYLRAQAPFDAARHVGRARPSALLFQFARRDEVVTEAAAAEYARAGSEPKVVKWYDATHEDIYRNAEALNDRLGWLRKRLGLGGAGGTPRRRPAAGIKSKVRPPGPRRARGRRAAPPAARVASAAWR